jgi:hypothetical protein
MRAIVMPGSRLADAVWIGKMFPVIGVLTAQPMYGGVSLAVVLQGERFKDINQVWISRAMFVTV